MAEYADLTPCDYITPNHDSKLIAVGWLARGVDYSKVTCHGMCSHAFFMGFAFR